MSEDTARRLSEHGSLSSPRAVIGWPALGASTILVPALVPLRRVPQHLVDSSHYAQEGHPDMSLNLRSGWKLTGRRRLWVLTDMPKAAPGLPATRKVVSCWWHPPCTQSSVPQLSQSRGPFVLLLLSQVLTGSVTWVKHWCRNFPPKNLSVSTTMGSHDKCYSPRRVFFQCVTLLKSFSDHLFCQAFFWRKQNRQSAQGWSEMSSMF